MVSYLTQSKTIKLHYTNYIPVVNNDNLMVTLSYIYC